MLATMEQFQVQRCEKELRSSFTEVNRLGLADVLERPARAQGTLIQSLARRGLRHAAGAQSGSCLIALLAPKSSTSA